VLLSLYVGNWFYSTLLYAKIIQKQKVMYDLLKSAGYLLTEIDFKGYCELNYIKLGNLFHMYGNSMID
jgi:hypothetical protein